MDIPSPFDGVRVGVDKMKTSWVPPPLRPLPPRGGEILSGYVFSIMDSLINAEFALIFVYGG
jgi:hypothetical protein